MLDDDNGPSLFADTETEDDNDETELNAVDVDAQTTDVNDLEQSKATLRAQVAKLLESKQEFEATLPMANVNPK